MTSPAGTGGEAASAAAERARRLVRREPPRFRRAVVEAVDDRSARLRRVRLRGTDLDGLTIEQPAASVRLLLPPPGADTIVIPEWTGNEFLLPDGTRPTIRTFTPRRLDPDDGRGKGPALDIEIVMHSGGEAADWARRARPGDEVAVSGTGRGFDVDDAVPSYLLAGDETAIPAISQLLEAIPPSATVDVHLEIGEADARVELPDHPRSSVTWHQLPSPSRPGDALIRAVEAAPVGGETHVWVAGEAAAVQRIRKLLADERDVPRSRSTVRGYWKLGRGGS